MSAADRVDSLERRLLATMPADLPAGARLAVGASVADCEAKVAAALALYLEGEIAALPGLLGTPTTDHGVTVVVSIMAALGAAQEALTATIGDDADRGHLAVMVLQERSAEFNNAHDEFLRRAEELANTT